MVVPVRTPAAVPGRRFGAVGEGIRCRNVETGRPFPAVAGAAGIWKVGGIGSHILAAAGGYNSAGTMVIDNLVARVVVGIAVIDNLAERSAAGTAVIANLVAAGIEVVRTDRIPIPVLVGADNHPIRLGIRLCCRIRLWRRLCYRTHHGVHDLHRLARRVSLLDRCRSPFPAVIYAVIGNMSDLGIRKHLFLAEMVIVRLVALTAGVPVRGFRGLYIAFYSLGIHRR